MNVCERFAKHVVDTTFEDLPQDVVETAVKDIFDTIGVAVAAAGREGGKELVEMYEPVGGKPECTIIGYDGLKLPLENAAIINGTTAHSLDFDDVTLSTGHMGVIIVPTALAVAQHVGDVSGKDIITAIVLGHDIACRLGEASVPLSLGPGWHYTPLYGIFGATAVAGKLLGLDADQMANAFGIAYTQAAGNRQSIRDGALSKRMAAGIADRAGCFSAVAAQHGITGPINCFDGDFGLFNVYHRGEFANEAALLDKLGERFTLPTVSFKSYPSCAATEPSIEATLELMKEHGFTADDVDHVVAHASIHSSNSCNPPEIKMNPRNEVDAQFSIPWVVACALVNGKVTIDMLTDEAVQDEAIREVCRKVTPVVDLETEGPGASFPGLVEITLKDGRVLSRREEVPTGHPSKPMSWEQLEQKFDGNVGTKGYTGEKLAQLKDVLRNIVNMQDVDELMNLI